MIKNIVMISLSIALGISIYFNIKKDNVKTDIPEVKTVYHNSYKIDTISIYESKVNVIDSIQYKIEVTHNPVTIPLVRDSLKRIIFYKNDSSITISGNITEDSINISNIGIKQNLDLAIKTDTNLLSIHYMVYPSSTNPNIVLSEPLPVYKHKQDRKYVKTLKTVFTILVTAIIVNRFHS